MPRFVDRILAALALASMLAGCAPAKPAEAPKPAPIAYDAADFTPKSELEMSFGAQGNESGTASKRSAPGATSYQPVMASRTKDAPR